MNDKLPQKASDIEATGMSLVIDRDAHLYDAMERIDKCRTGFTMFVADENEQIVGVLTRGDIVRFVLDKHKNENGKHAGDYSVWEAMKPRKARNPHDDDTMLYIQDESPKSWYTQLTEIRDTRQEMWHRIKLIPVLDRLYRLIQILDLEIPKSRERLEILVMATEFADKERRDFTAEGLEKRRTEYDSVHYNTQLRKVKGLCRLLLEERDGEFNFIDSIFNNGRADEVVLGLHRAEEWLKGFIAIEEEQKKERSIVLNDIESARKYLTKRYKSAGVQDIFPGVGAKEPVRDPQIIVVLGCPDDRLLTKRVSKGLRVVRNIDFSKMDGNSPVLVLSGGGGGHSYPEAERMYKKLSKACARLGYEIYSVGNSGDMYRLLIDDNEVLIILEKDSLDTLGNAIFSWLVLRERQKQNEVSFGLTSKDSNKLRRMVLVTDDIHAPRSYDIFRRVFAFRTIGRSEPYKPSINVQSVTTYTETDEKAAKNLESEAKTNTEIFRLTNPLTHNLDVVEEGHVRSILAQMIQHHRFYGSRWDLVRKYQECLNDPPID